MSIVGTIRAPHVTATDEAQLIFSNVAGSRDVTVMVQNISDDDGSEGATVYVGPADVDPDSVGSPSGVAVRAGQDVPFAVASQAKDGATELYARCRSGRQALLAVVLVVER